MFCEKVTQSVTQHDAKKFRKAEFSRWGRLVGRVQFGQNAQKLDENHKIKIFGATVGEQGIFSGSDGWGFPPVP